MTLSWDDFLEGFKSWHPDFYGKAVRRPTVESGASKVSEGVKPSTEPNVPGLAKGFEAPTEAPKQPEPERTKITRNFDPQELAAGEDADERWWDPEEEPPT